ncbi:MAG TPA: CehA/McbA family metallohydrolase [Anaerolineales bacterium]|nr:CehA/McbA family metallohydrolase [Anaerolineales bacterium]
MVHEYVGNLHAHTFYSDGWADHETVALEALAAGLDFVVTTDHNVYVEGFDGYRYAGGRRILLLAGEEIHDQARRPQKNHLLVYETRRELAQLAHDPERLLSAVEQLGGVAFLAHPIDPASAAVGQPDLSWVDWDVRGYAGLEIWNMMTEFKSLLRSRLDAVFYAFRPTSITRDPFPASLARWDELLRNGQRVTGIGGADAHAFTGRLGPIRRTIFPYAFLFRGVGTHVLTDEPLTGDVDTDRQRLFHSLGRGRSFVAYDRPASTRGFRFSAQGDLGSASIGGSVPVGTGVTLQVHLPRRAHVRLVRSGDLVGQWWNVAGAVETVTVPGAYRVEARLPYRGALRGWIFSNPIYVTF